MSVKERNKIIKTFLAMFNDLFSAMMDISLGFATTQTRAVVDQVIKEYPEVFKGFRLELRELNFFIIKENSRELEDRVVIEAMQKLIDSMHAKCKSLVGNVGVFVSDKSRIAIRRNYDILEKYGLQVPEEFCAFKGGAKSVKLPYGKGFVEVEVPITSEVVLPRETNPLRDFKFQLKSRLDAPLGCDKIEKMIKKDQRVAIIVDDHTRKTPVDEILPVVLKNIGKITKNITIVVATGLHRKPTEEELRRKVGDVGYPVVIHDADAGDLVPLGKTLTGVELRVNKEVAEADFVVSIGTLEPHPYAGFSGGSKCILPGVANKEAIVSSHLLNVFPGCQAGKLRRNPMREEIENAGQLTNLGFIINVILDKNKEVVDIFCGDPRKAFEEGANFCREIYVSEYSEKADIVIVTPGGYPKDANLDLSLRALKTAETVLKEEGIIVLVAKCEEFVGRKLRKYMKYKIKDFLKEDPRDLISFSLLQKYPLIMVSDIEKELMERAGVKVFRNVNDALLEAINRAVDSRVVVIYDAYIIPVMKS